MNHLVQIGVLGSIGRFRALDMRQRQRGTQVVCRTERGLEIGSVLKPLHEADTESDCDGELLRQVTPDDRLIINRIDRFRDRAFNACQGLLAERGLQATLVDVGHLFDGQSLYFYFLGEVSEQVNQLTAELAEAYEAKVKFRKFSQTLAEGCGPECGTKEGGGCGTSGCGSCPVRTACKS